MSMANTPTGLAAIFTLDYRKSFISNGNWKLKTKNLKNQVFYTFDSRLLRLIVQNLNCCMDSMNDV